MLKPDAPIIDLLAEITSSTASHPSQIVAMADRLQQVDPNFNRERFIQRGTAQWEDQHADELAAQQADYFAMVNGKEGADV